MYHVSRESKISEKLALITGEHGVFPLRNTQGKVGSIMTLHAHYEVIQFKHHKLEQLINEESHRPLPDLAMLQTLKKQKLLLKEEMERIRAQQSERLDAA